MNTYDLLIVFSSGEEIRFVLSNNEPYNYDISSGTYPDYFITGNETYCCISESGYQYDSFIVPIKGTDSKIFVNFTNYMSDDYFGRSFLGNIKSIIDGDEITKFELIELDTI